jgi:hypothetical protein
VFDLFRSKAEKNGTSEMTCSVFLINWKRPSQNQ